MGAMVVELMQILISEEIRRIVADAVEERTTLSASAAAAQIMRTYPNSGLSEREIADEIMVAAACAGVAVEISRAEAA